MPSYRNRVTYSQRPNHAARAAHAKGDRAFRTYDTSAIRPKRSPVPAIVAVVLLLALLAAIIWVALSFTGVLSSPKLLPEGETAEVTVVEGETAQTIGASLVSAGLIANSSEFTDRVAQLDAASQLRPGTYFFTRGDTVDEIITALMAGPQEMTFTVPEGSTLAQTAAIVDAASGGAVSADAFIAAASDASAYAVDFPFLAEAGSSSLEGFLFPKTYLIAADATADSLVRAMLSQYQVETAALDYSYAESRGLSAYDVLKLAAIVEKESDAGHRATVASVFYNRLAAGMRLQSDATVAYFAGHDPTPEDVATDDPYNTYTIDGLTPTPINSPSLEALKAVCSPEETTYLYFYFARDSAGVMQYYFSETYEEHQATYA